MPKAGLFAAQYRDHIVKVVNRVGVERALSHNGLGILYSGPNKAVFGIIGGELDKNSLRSEIMASRLRGTRINDTWIASRLGERDLQDYFAPVYSDYVSPSIMNSVTNACYATVWSGISKLFASLPFDEAATAVCGSQKGRVFLRYELPELVKNPHPFAINKTPMDAARRMYNEVSVAETFDLICLSELKMAFNEAGKDTTSNPREALQDYVDRLHFYKASREHFPLEKGALTRAQEKNKQHIVEEYKLEGLYEKSPETWGGALVSAIRPKLNGSVRSTGINL